MVDVEMPPAELARYHRHFAAGLWETIRPVPGARRHQWGPPGRAVLFTSGFPASEANLLVVGDGDGDLGAIFDWAVETLGPRTPWRLIFTGADPAGIDRVASARGLVPGATEPGMVLDPIPRSDPPPASLDLRVVSTEGELDGWRRAWCRSFGIPASVSRLLYGRIPRPDATGEGETRLVVGYEADRPVVCSAAFVSDGIVGISSVGTVPSARRRGYGAAATVRAAAEGAALGGRSAFLLASPMGYPVYAKLGFRTFHQYPSWRVPMGLIQGLRALWRVHRLLAAARSAG